MQARRAVGQGAAAKKYDMLTALGAMGCAGTGSQQRSTLRFMTLVTARYNWTTDELSMGRAEMARLWQVNERTVKRELAKLRGRGWLMTRRAAARGRVTCYRIDWDRVLADTAAHWMQVGPDFVGRMQGLAMPDGAAATMSAPVPASTVIAFPAPDAETDDPWTRMRGLLHGEDPAFFASWCAALHTVELSDGVLHLAAPSGFHAQYLATHGMERLYRALARTAPDIRRIEIGVAVS